jgi:hypothetical protein
MSMNTLKERIGSFNNKKIFQQPNYNFLHRFQKLKRESSVDYRTANYHDYSQPSIISTNNFVMKGRMVHTA